jgi:CRISPR/Cas system-associated endonuclease Cas1
MPRMIEAFRPLCADSVVVRAVNNGEIRSGDFVDRMGAVNLTETGRRKFLRAFELRLSQAITHPARGGANAGRHAARAARKAGATVLRSMDRDLARPTLAAKGQA